MGERYLGRIVSAGATTNNLTTATPFPILPGAKLTLVPSVAGQVAVDFAACINTPTAPNYGIPVTAGQTFPTSVGQGQAAMANSPGTSTALISWLPTSGAGNLDVWIRGGQE